MKELSNQDRKFEITLVLIPEAVSAKVYLEPSQTTKMEIFAKIVNG